MSFKADPRYDFKLWDYITGDYFKGMSIIVDRWYYLVPLIYRHEVKVAFRDPDTNAWTTWDKFPGKYLLEEGQLTAAIDVHRSVFPYEIVIESDYPTYEENYDASQIIGAILEKKGFVPHYYFSGNKSVHCLPTKTEVFIKTKTGIRKSTMGEIERLFKTNKNVEIMGPDGFVQVKNATRRKQKENENLIRIYTRNGKRLDMSKDHLQIINRKHRIIIVQAKDLKVSDRIIYTRKGYEGHGGTYELGKFLGLFLAEGSVNKGQFQFTFDKTETHLSDFIKKLSEKYGSLVRIRKEDKCIRLSFTCQTLGAFINDFSIGKTAKLKGIKSKAYGMSKEFRYGILDGWFEGDGDHKTKNNGVTVSSGLAKCIVFLCTSLGIRVSKHSYFGKSGFTEKRIRFYKLRKIFKRHGHSTVCTPFPFPCAFDTIKYINKTFKKKTEFIDIEVNSENHLFCLANGIITHNCHVFFDWVCLDTINMATKEKIKEEFNNNEEFKKKFMEWLRAKMINCWDTKLRKFDTDLVRASHLIRCELSRNKLGFKTFLGYSYKDLSFIPYICNENNRIYPRIGPMVKSCSNNPDQLIMDYFAWKREEEQRQAILRKNMRSNNFIPEDKTDIRDCVKIILDDEFKKVNDGTARGMFILVNELKKVFGIELARTITNDWNERMGFPNRMMDIEYRLKTREYSLSHDYIHTFLKELGIDVDKKCKGKVYKS